jgi:hypothetical protein
VEDLTLLLVLNHTLFMPGMEFRLETFVINPYPDETTLDLYVLLDVYGDFFFWPSWGRDIDKAERTYRPDQPPETILQFTWPEGAGEASGLGFWGALFQPGTFDLVSLDHETFGFTEEPVPTPTPSPTPRPSPTPTPLATGTVGPHSFVIPGNVAWLDTGLDVEAGSVWIIEAWGEICFHIGDCEGTRVGPCGLDEICYDQECQTQPYQPGFHHGALIARVDNGEVFLVCDRYDQPMPGSGRLFLGINDGNVEDNGLQFEALIHPPRR